MIDPSQGTIVSVALIGIAGIGLPLAAAWRSEWREERARDERARYVQAEVARRIEANRRWQQVGS